MFYNNSFPIGTKIVYSVQENGTFFEVILPKQKTDVITAFDDNLIKAILNYENGQ